VEPDICTKL